MLMNFLKAHVGQNTAPLVAVGLFVFVVGASLWLTPRLAKWIDTKRKGTPGFYDGMMERPPKDEEDKE